MPVYKRFVLQWLGLVLGLAGLVLLFNRVVDPFDYYRDTAITGFNAVKNRAERYEREVKPVILERLRPRLVILGSSYAEIGFDPDGPALRGRHAYNFALAGAHWNLVYCHALYALDMGSVRQLIVGIHPETMPTLDCSREENRVHRAKPSQLLLSLPALKASVSTLLKQRQEPNHTANGLYFYERTKPGADRRFVRDLGLLSCRSGDPTRGNGAKRRIDLSGLEALLRSAQGRGVEVTLVFYPHHGYYFETLLRCAGAEEKLWAHIETIAASVAEFPRASLWLFYDYNAYTLEPVHPGTMRYWQDPSHFNREFGEVMLERIFSSSADADGLGIRLGRGKVAAARARFERLRQQAHSARPEFFAALRELLPQ